MDHGDLSMAYSKMIEVAVYINEGKRNQEKMGKMEDIHKKVVGLEVSKSKSSGISNIAQDKRVSTALST
jgi:hypothetical protein